MFPHISYQLLGAVGKQNMKLLLAQQLMGKTTKTQGTKSCANL